MKKIVVILFFLSIGLPMFSQNAGTIKVQKPVVKGDSARTLGKFYFLKVECQYWRYTFLNLEADYKYMSAKALANFEKDTWGASLQAQYKIIIGRRFNPTIRFGPTFFIHQNKTDLALTPEVRFGHGWLSISYGYNFVLGRRDISVINTHFVTLKYSFGFFK